MDRAVQARVYPERLRKGSVGATLRFWRTLLGMLRRPEQRAGVRAFVMFSGPAVVRRAIWSHYLTPRSGYRPIALAPDAERALDALTRDGIVTLERNFSALADDIRTRYMDDALSPDSPLRRHGLDVSRSVSFSDERLHEVLFDPAICGIVCNYYGRQGFYRDNPTVHREHTTADSMPLVSGVFHSDGYRQISFMLLLADMTESDTHMEFAKGSHRSQQPSYDLTAIDQDAVPREFEIVHLVGPKGTLYMFDTEGLHRGAYRAGGRREILHVNITPGTLPFTDQPYDALTHIFPDLARIPPHVRDFVAHAVR